MIQNQIWCFAELVFSCQDDRFRPLHLYCIYRISYKIAKKANPKNEIRLSDIRKHKVFEIMLSFDL